MIEFPFGIWIGSTEYTYAIIFLWRRRGKWHSKSVRFWLK